ncbi:hypothetical protein [Halarsenatibacter silvermanii]|nr:hypothetical protein [Halarsenatibacter silvermanii]
MTELKNTAACLDADIIIKTIKIEKSLFRDILDLFDIIYLHESVYEEINWPPKAITFLDSLIEENKIEVWSDEKLLESFEEKCPGRKLLFSAFNNSLKYFGYEKNFEINLENASHEDLIYKLEKIEKGIGNNLGEIKTICFSKGYFSSKAVQSSPLKV